MALSPKQKQLAISVSHIVNWPQPQAQTYFQISFYSKLDHSLIISKSVLGHYEKSPKIMTLKCLLMINYLDDQHVVVLRLAYRMAFGGQIIIGDFTIDLDQVKMKKTLTFPISKSKAQYLVVEEYQLKDKKQTISRVKVDQDQYGLQRFQGLNNEDFIRQRQQFLERHSNRSQASSSRSNPYTFFSSRVNQLLTQVKDYKVSRNSQKKQSNTRRSSYLSNLISSKNQPRQSNYSQFKQQKRYGDQYHRQNGENQSERINKSSSKHRFVLFVNNLNIVPCQEYYETKIRQMNIKDKGNTEAHKKMQIGRPCQHFNDKNNIYSHRHSHQESGQKLQLKSKQKNRFKSQLQRVQSQYY